MKVKLRKDSKKYVLALSYIVLKKKDMSVFEKIVSETCENLSYKFIKWLTKNEKLLHYKLLLVLSY